LSAAPPPDSFAAAFAIERTGDGLFEASLDGFGGHTLGCATLAAARTVTGLSLHSIHTCFVRPVPTDRPARLQVSSLSDGRRFARRRVEIRDGEKLCFDLIASFAAASEGPEFADDPPAPPPPQPEDLPSELEVAAAEGWQRRDDHPHPIELRWCGRPWAVDGPCASSRYDAWVRPIVAPADDALRAAGIAFVADFHSHWPVARMLGGNFEPNGFTSLDQSVWIHREDAWNDWWLLTSWAELGHAGRSLGHRTLRARNGDLIASMAQEALIPGARLR